jgi:hypothetical protein
MEWFVARNGQRMGPLTFDAMVDAAKRGQLAVDDYVWTPGMPEWKPAGSIAAFWSPPPPPPPTQKVKPASALPTNSKWETAPQTNRPPPADQVPVTAGNSKLRFAARVILSLVIFFVGTVLVGIVKEARFIREAFDRGQLSLITVTLQVAIVVLLYYIWSPPKSDSS